jgi:hypothetical protein
MATPRPASAAESRISGSLSLEGGAPAALEVRLIGLDDGRVATLRSDSLGRFGATLAPGTYALEAGTGYRIARGPRIVSLRAGDGVDAALVLAAAAYAPVTIEHERWGCELAETRSYIETRIVPPDPVEEARVYFRSNRTLDFFYMPMQREGERFFACLPATLENAGPVEYYFTARTASAPTRSPLFSLAVVRDAPSCPADTRPLRPCPPGVGMMAYDASGAAAGSLPGGGAGASTIGGVIAVGAGGLGITTILLGSGPASPSR